MNTDAHVVCPWHTLSQVPSPFAELGLPLPAAQAEPAAGFRGGSAQVAQLGRGLQGQHADLSSRPERVPAGWGRCNKTLCLWNEWSARKLSLSRQFHCVSHGEVSPGACSSLCEPAAWWTCLPRWCWFRAGGLLIGDDDLLTIYKRLGSCESSKVLEPLHLCARLLFSLSHAPGMTRSMGSWLPWMKKAQCYPLSPTSCLDCPLGPLAMMFATSSYAHASLAPKRANVDPCRLSAALAKLLLRR